MSQDILLSILYSIPMLDSERTLHTMEDVKKKALNTFQGTTPIHWFRYMDDTWVKIKIQEVQAFRDHINTVDLNIEFTREDTRDNRLAFLDCSHHRIQKQLRIINLHQSIPAV